ncbi:MAG TPA: hypothetical protein VIM07_13395 [Chitinophagaceae bacterium]
MRILEIIYFSQYYELKKSGKDPQKGRLNGTLLSATIIILNIASIFIILLKVAPYLQIVQWLKNLFTGYEGSGKIIGKCITAILLIAIGGLLWLTVGSKKSYNKIAEKFIQYSEEAQQKTIKQSLFIFLFSFVLFLILIFIP